MHSRARIRVRRGTFLLALSLGVLAGVGIASRRYVLSSHWALLVLLSPVFWHKRSFYSLLLVVLLGVALGWSRGTVMMGKLAEYKPLSTQKITLAVVAKEDAVYGNSKQLTFIAGDVRLENGKGMAGKIQLSGFGVNAVYEGDSVLATGKLRPASGSVQGRMSFAQLQIISHHPSFISVLRRQFTAGMQSALPEPQAPFAMGLLIGQRSNMPDAIKQDLLKVGLTHIIAVSGYNLTIILHGSRRILTKHSKRLSTCLSLGLIALFLILTGASASIVRAAIVSLLSIVTAYYGRSIKPFNLLALVAAITAWANPFYVWGDLSWYLSFLAFFGVMIIAPLIQKRFPLRWQDSILISVALESVSAEIMTIPIILKAFGQMSLVGLPANVLVVSLVPLAMLLSLIAGLAGMLAGAAAGWLAWPAVALLSYMLGVAHVMARLPHIFLQNLSLSLNKMLILYGLIVLMTLLLHHKTNRPKNATITDNVRSQQMVNHQASESR